ncbi:RagB/SusD family nutrient uptake outer membrane protein [Chitinophaga oryziterrae]|uniref:RagB/SusD family nutrient uptake outer membrane protein n=1 Tax=Chitinophaga oryziterrae TaxID=1031224 RepID=A0A6N8JHE2_9BACT|nr:RagB/SusD family nutrient uptake outer membrane protein [Chitinophaga oryziterrae]MVT44725.1 RagB/SusD family nutrient uptake outer membrane protein [Chitinophaga oryziterrae]
MKYKNIYNKGFKSIYYLLMKFIKSNSVFTRLILLLFFVFFNSCDKLVDIPQPVDSLTSVEAFSTDENAIAVITGVYSNLSYNKGRNNFVNTSLSSLCGSSADELIPLSDPLDPFQTNNLLETDGFVYNQFWSSIYNTVYEANAVLEGVSESTTLTSRIKLQLRGEALFLRAFSYFYLVNLFGDVPLVTNTAWAKNNLLQRSPVGKIYSQIEIDLKEAQTLLPQDYSITNGERIRATSWAATALLARVYLYTGNWNNAEIESDKVISKTDLYALQDNLNDVFLKNNNEAIWQLQVSADRSPYATREAFNFVPRGSSYPNYYITSQLLGSFEKDDKRLTVWVGISGSSPSYYYPSKYKIRQGTSGSTNEYYTLLRVSEQYLIRAEAKAEQNNLEGAVSDLNIIRARAGLTDLSAALNQEMMRKSIAQENRVEFFAELGHRWFDLKRTNQAAVILKSIKGENWQNTDVLYPIPLSERKIDPSLIQNPGY